MSNEMESKNNPPFYERFGIEVNLDEAKLRFVNRVLNAIDSKMNGLATKHEYPYRYSDEMIYVASVLGEEASGASPFKYYTGTDFNRLLVCLEALYAALKEYKSFGSPWESKNLDDIITWALSVSEVDLGIDWDNGVFRKKGAQLLDDQLVKEPMKWLSDIKYTNVFKPFQKGLKQYLESTREPTKLADSITDIYEAMEALAKIVCGNNRDLSANREQFVNKLGLNDYFSKMLRDYISFANEYRHGVEQTKTRATPNPNEVEAFIYMTGLFIRLAMRQLNS